MFYIYRMISALVGRIVPVSARCVFMYAKEDGAKA